MAMRRLLSHISCWLLAATAMACTEEDLSECEQGVRLQYRYVLNSQHANLFGPQVARAEAYVFDSDGLYVGTYTDHGAHLTNDYVMLLPLPPGQYSILVWAHENEYDTPHYDQGYLYDAQTRSFGQDLHTGVTSIEQFRLMLQHHGTIPGTPGPDAPDEEPKFLVSDGPEDLFHGLVMRVASQANPPVHPVDMIKNTNEINVIVEGLDAFAGDPLFELPEIYVTARDGLYDYRNNIPDDARRLMYAPHDQTHAGDRLEARITVLRLMTDASAAGPTLLTVMDPVTGAVFYEADVVETLMGLRDGGGDYLYRNQQDLDREDVFTFRIRVDADMNVTVWVNGWEVKEITPEL